MARQCERCRKTNKKKYWSIKDCLSIKNDLILFGESVMILTAMQESILEKIHEHHLGQEKSILRVKNNVYWCGINSGIIRKVQECNICNQDKNQQPKEPLLQHEVPLKPMEKVAADLFEIDGHYIVIADYFS